MESIENNLGRLQKIENNFRKAPNREYSKNFLQSKLNETRTLRDQIVNELACIEENLEETLLEQNNKEILLLSSKIFRFIESKLFNAKSRPKYTLKNLAQLAIICKKN